MKSIFEQGSFASIGHCYMNNSALSPLPVDEHRTSTPYGIPKLCSCRLLAGSRKRSVETDEGRVVARRCATDMMLSVRDGRTAYGSPSAISRPIKEEEVDLFDYEDCGDARRQMGTIS